MPLENQRSSAYILRVRASDIVPCIYDTLTAPPFFFLGKDDELPVTERGSPCLGTISVLRESCVGKVDHQCFEHKSVMYAI